MTEPSAANPPTIRYSTSRSRFRIVSGSNATKLLDGIGKIGGALDPFLHAQLEETVEETFINLLVRITLTDNHIKSLAHDNGEGDPTVGGMGEAAF